MQAVRVHLHVRFTATVPGRDELLAVGPKIAIGILQQPDVRRFAYEHAAIEHLQRSRLDQTVGKHRTPVHAPVAVRVFQHHDASDGIVFARRLDIAHVAGQLDRPHAPGEIPFDEDGILNHRLAGRELETIAGRKGKRGERFGRREHRRRSRRFLDSRRPLLTGDRRVIAITGERRREHRERDDADRGVLHQVAFTNFVL